MELLCCCWPTQAFTRQPLLCGGRLKLQELSWKVRRGSQAWSKNLAMPVCPSTPLPGDTFPECCPHPSSHITFLPLSSPSPHLKACTRGSSPPAPSAKRLQVLEQVRPLPSPLRGLWGPWGLLGTSQVLRPKICADSMPPPQLGRALRWTLPANPAQPRAEHGALGPPNGSAHSSGPGTTFWSLSQNLSLPSGSSLSSSLSHTTTPCPLLTAQPTSSPNSTLFIPCKSLPKRSSCP